MSKFLDPSFSSRPATQAYRDNFDRTFKSEPVPFVHRETVHAFVSICDCQNNCPGSTICRVCDGRKDSKSHKHMYCVCGALKADHTEGGRRCPMK